MNVVIKVSSVLLLLNKSALLARILASHDVGANDASVSTGYPTRALVNELQRHNSCDSFMLSLQKAHSTGSSFQI